MSDTESGHELLQRMRDVMLKSCLGSSQTIPPFRNAGAAIREIAATRGAMVKGKCNGTAKDMFRDKLNPEKLHVARNT